MGLWPTRGDENQVRRPRESRGPIVSPMDSRFRGNDVIFRAPLRVGLWDYLRLLRMRNESIEGLIVRHAPESASPAFSS